MSVSFWNKNPNKLIQKWLVSSKFYSGIMWQPWWTRSWTKLIPISCKRPLKVFIPRSSLFALLSEHYKFQWRWSHNPLLTASLPLKERGIGIFGFAVIAIFWSDFRFWCSLQLADFPFFSIWFSVFAKTLTGLRIWYPMRFSVFPIRPIWVPVSLRSGRELRASTDLE